MNAPVAGESTEVRRSSRLQHQPPRATTPAGYPTPQPVRPDVVPAPPAPEGRVLRHRVIRAGPSDVSTAPKRATSKKRAREEDEDEKKAREDKKKRVNCEFFHTPPPPSNLL